MLFSQKRHPSEMGAIELESSLTYLAMHGQVAAATQNQALRAWLFRSAEVLRQPLDDAIKAARAKRPERLLPS